MIHRLGMLELMTPCMLVPPPHFIGSLEQRKKVVMWFSNKLVFLRQTGIKAPTGKLTLELGPGTVTKFCGSLTIATSPITHPSSSPRCFSAVMRAVKGSQDGDSQGEQNLGGHESHSTILQ